MKGGVVYHWRPTVAEAADEPATDVLSKLDHTLGRFLARWVARVTRRPRATVLLVLFIAVLLAGHAVSNLAVNTNENDLFSDDVPYQALRRDWNRAFPSLVDPLVIVVDAERAEASQTAADLLARELAARPEHFGRIHRPGGGAFFERNAFLYLDTDDLDALLTNLHGVQPYLAELSADPSLRGFARLLAQTARARAQGELVDVDLASMLGRVHDVIDAQLTGRAAVLSFGELISGESTTRRDRRRFLLVQPVVDFERLQPAEASLTALRESIEELTPRLEPDVRIRTTGVFPLAYEEMEHLDSQTRLAGALSFVAVGTILMLGLGSGRLVFACLVTLLVGLGATAGFASLAIGHLNLISVAFAVLFIGLSIDFAIHLCLRLREELVETPELERALPRAARAVGGSLCLCALTTAIGFFAFAPTEYTGVAELGIIAGSGMFISLVLNLTLLPALIQCWVPGSRIAAGPRTSVGASEILAIPVRYAGAVLFATAAVTAAALWLLPGARFDPNPLRVRDPSTPSVQVFQEMLQDGDALPWTLNALTHDLASAEALAAHLETLPSVDFTVSLADFIPDDQEQRRALIDEAAFVLLPSLEHAASAASETSPSPAAQRRALHELLQSLVALQGEPATSPETVNAAESLAASLASLDARLEAGETALLARVEAALVGGVPASLRSIRRALEPEAVSIDTLPGELVERNVAVDGRFRVEIFPLVDLGDPAELTDYVRSVQSIAPDTFGEALVILETGEVVVGALSQALATAAILIAVLLYALWQSVRDSCLVAVPLALAALLTTASSVVLSVPFNFANVIVIPLLLGMGVDTSIHLVHRFRTDAPPGGNLLRTSTAAAVLLSALTTIASFGSLGLASHLGMASLGRLLALGIALILACNLAVLPALIQVAGPAERSP
jgi:hopanoid biosynthesis associated RND transporter like protein HpnN